MMTWQQRAVPGVLAMACVSLASAQLGQLIFPNPEFAAGDYANGVAAGDLNGDARPDIVTANAGAFDLFGFHTGTTVSVLLNAGDGTLEAPMNLPTGLGPTDVAIADVDLDGDLDIVAVTAESEMASIFRNSGDGVVYTQAVLFAGPDPFAVALGDLNGDGFSDMAVTNLGVPLAPQVTVSILMNDGAGAFVISTPLLVGTRPADVLIGDVTSDGANDIVVANFDSGDIHVFVNDGRGALALESILSANSGENEGPAALAIGDLDGDGLVDLAAGQAAGFPSTGRVSVFLGHGDGTFDPEQPLVGIGDVRGVAVRDIDDDGAPDIVGSSLAGVVGVFAGDGKANFEPVVQFQSGSAPQAMTLVDLDADGIEEVVTANSVGDNVSVLRGLGGAFGSDQVFIAPAAPRGATLADVDDDGLHDLVLPAGTGVTILFGAPDGSFPLSQTTPVGAFAPRSVVADDLDGDGDVDLATLGNSSMVVPGHNVLASALSVRLQSASGMFPFESLTPFPEFILGIARHDVEPDGDTDLIAVAAAPDERVIMLTNDGSGRFQESGSFTFDSGSQVQPLAMDASVEVSTADLNGDGLSDLAFMPNVGQGVAPNNRVVVMLGTGGGAFGPAVAYPVGQLSRTLAVDDFNDDGAPDLAVANAGAPTLEGSSTGTSVSVLFNEGDGSFAPFQSITSGSGTRAVAAGDIDGDGDADLIVSSAAQNVAVLVNDGRGGFSLDNRFGIGIGTLDVLVHDVNADDALDVISIQVGVNSVSVLLNQLGDAPGACPGDLNNSGDVNAADLALLLGNWNCTDDCIAELNGEPPVNAADLALLLGAWGDCPAK